jgi:hypothetical protein
MTEICSSLGGDPGVFGTRLAEPPAVGNERKRSTGTLAANDGPVTSPPPLTAKSVAQWAARSTEAHRVVATMARGVVKTSTTHVGGPEHHGSFATGLLESWPEQRRRHPNSMEILPLHR